MHTAGSSLLYIYTENNEYLEDDDRLSQKQT